jgi:adenylosuccinate lyase
MRKMIHSPLTALTSLDGRYSESVAQLRPYLSEWGLIHYRTQVEIQWLIHLAQSSFIPELKPFSEDVKQALLAIVSDFSVTDAEEIKALERKTNHDVKALEYWLRNKVYAIIPENNVLEFIHFGCTSEDINNLAYSLMLKESLRHIFIPTAQELTQHLQHLAKQWAAIPMLSRTHGQTATPTTVGKELANITQRLKRQQLGLENQVFLGKFNGAVGNYNAHQVAYPTIDWPNFCAEFVESLGLQFNPMTTQIEPHDWIAELMHTLARFNTIVLDADRDLWGYISIGYFKQKIKEGEVGSSTMPHKVNPIDFENSEGNIGVSNALLYHLAEKLPVSRWQRDLTDSTVLRTLGTALGHALLAWKSTLKGLRKLEIDEKKMHKDLELSWEVLAEPIQTVMRKLGLENAYDQLKALTRGQAMTQEKLQEFIQSLTLPEADKKELIRLTPSTYIGLAQKLTEQID